MDDKDVQKIIEMRDQARVRLEKLVQEGARFPPDFDKQTPFFQLSWVQRKIPQLKQEISLLEKQLADFQQNAQKDQGLILSFFNAALASGPAMQFKAKKDFLDEMEIREKVLTQQLSPQFALPPAKPTRDEQIKALLGEAGQLKAECAQVCATITDQALRDQIEHDYDDRIRKKYQQITKL